MIETKAVEGQEYFRLIVETGLDFETFVPTSTCLECLALGKSVVEWNAEILSGSDDRGVLYHDFGTGTSAVPEKGTYKIRCKLIIDGKIVYSHYVDWIVG